MYATDLTLFSLSLVLCVHRVDPGGVPEGVGGDHGRPARVGRGHHEPSLDQGRARPRCIPIRVP